MLEHMNSTPTNPQRCVVIGANGFVGKAIVKNLDARGIDIRLISRSEIDLLASDASSKLKALVEPTDSVVLVSAIAPVKNLSMLQDNLKIISAFDALLRNGPFAHALNISSDAIYGDVDAPLSEKSLTHTSALHGIMHLTREAVLVEAAGNTPFATLRPTLIYGESDPHNGYGPNRFRRQAAAGDNIILFGEGEERRDHVAVEDVAELATRILTHRSVGALNAATGTVISFREAADAIAGFYGNNVEVRGSPRSGPMPHNGYRPFNPSATKKAFPDFQYTQPIDGFRKIFDNEQKG